MNNVSKGGFSINDLVDDKILLYKIFSNYFHFSVFVFLLFFLIFSFLVGVFGVDCNGRLYALLCGYKLLEIEKSQLPVTDFLKNFIFAYNLVLVVSPFLIFWASTKQKVNMIEFGGDQLFYSLKMLFLGFILTSLSFLCVFITPFSENIWGHFFYHNSYIYYISSAFSFVCYLAFFSSFLFILKVIFIHRKGGK